jgi:hypothetical protein
VQNNWKTVDKSRFARGKVPNQLNQEEYFYTLEKPDFINKLSTAK